MLESVKELPPLQVPEIKGEGLCHDRTVSRRPRLMYTKTCGSELVGAKLARDTGDTVQLQHCVIVHREQALLPQAHSTGQGCDIGVTAKLMLGGQYGTSTASCCRICVAGIAVKLIPTRLPGWVNAERDPEDQQFATIEITSIF
ncbi:hypothetical protein J3P80_19690 [Pseudomonas sp. D2-30]|uniref:hypothetical protein n=1 Tax=unclassified Pseudomonas TaxID=196821 RepID=UPI003DA8B334